MRFPGFWIPTATKGKLFRRTSRTKLFPAMPGGHSNSARYNPRTGEIDEDWRRCQHQELGVWELSTPPRRPADGRFFPNEYGQIHFPHSPFFFFISPFSFFLSFFSVFYTDKYIEKKLNVNDAELWINALLNKSCDRRTKNKDLDCNICSWSYCNETCCHPIIWKGPMKQTFVSNSYSLDLLGRIP